MLQLLVVALDNDLEHPARTMHTTCQSAEAQVSLHVPLFLKFSRNSCTAAAEVMHYTKLVHHLHAHQ
jgi:hypothetical protein